MTKRVMKKGIVVLALVVMVSIITSCISQPPRPGSEGPNPLDDFAKCIKQSGLKIYGSFTCSTCKRQRELFGSAWQYVGEIECHPRGENPQTELCLEKNIEKTPTWIFEKDGVDMKRVEGFQDLEGLAELSGCEIGTV